MPLDKIFIIILWLDSDLFAQHSHAIIEVHQLQTSLPTSVLVLA